MEQSINSFKPNTLEVELKNFIITTLEQAVKEYRHKTTSEWLSLKEGASYAGVAYNTFIKFRTTGLKVSEIGGVKRVSKTEIDTFLNLHSY